MTTFNSIHEIGHGKSIKEHVSTIHTLNTFEKSGTTYLASGSSGDKKINLWENKNSVVTSYSIKSSIRALTTFLIDEVVFIACCGELSNDIEVWNTETNEVECYLSGHTRPVYTLEVWCKDNQCFLISAGDDKTIKIWDVKAKECTNTLEGHVHWIRCLAVYEDGGKFFLASGGYDNTVRIWDLEEKSLITTLSGHPNFVFKVLPFKKDVMYLAVARQDKTVQIWNLDTKSLEATLSGHEHFILALTTFMIQDKLCLASGCNDGTIKLWDLANYDLLRTLSVPGKLPTRSLCTFYDAKDDVPYLVSGHTTGSTMWWSV